MPKRPKIKTLQNGMRVASVAMAEVETASISLWVDVGARHEPERLNGISHLLEHMMFKGTETRSAKEIAEEFDAIGGLLNAYTSREHTVYYAKVLKEHASTALAIIADIVQFSTMDKDELAREQDVVIQEIAQSEDSPDDIIFDHFQTAAYPAQALGRSILGPEENIARFHQDDLFFYTSEHYHPSNMVLGVAGNIDHTAIHEQAEHLFQKQKPGKIRAAEKGVYHGGDFRKARDLEQLHVILGFNSVSYNDPDFYTLQMLSTILGGGMSSRLFQEIREKRGLAYTIQPYIASYSDSGHFSVYAGTSPEKGAELVKVIAEEILKITTNLEEKELDRARAQLKASILMEQESTTIKAEELGRNLMCYGRPVAHEEILENIMRVEAADISKLMARMLHSAPPTLAATGNLGNLPEYDEVQGYLKA